MTVSMPRKTRVRRLSRRLQPGIDRERESFRKKKVALELIKPSSQSTMLKPSVRISSLSLSSRVAGSALGRPALRAPTPWICASCLRRPLARASSLQLKKSFSSSLGARQDDGQLKAASGTSWAPSDTKPFYVTTPIFYVNACEFPVFGSWAPDESLTVLYV